MKKIVFLLSMVTICMSCAKEMNPAGNEEQTPSASGAREVLNAERQECVRMNHVTGWCIFRKSVRLLK